MLITVALVPDVAVLVPGAAGDAEVLADVRAAALGAVAAVQAERPERLLVVAPGDREELWTGRRPSLAAAGIADAWVAPGWGIAADDARPRLPVAASVGVALLHRSAPEGAGPPDPVVLTVPADLSPARCRERGRDLAGPGSLGMVVVGSGSARHGPDGPLADDARAADVDAQLVADLADAGPEARARLAGLDPGLARELAVTGRAPWQVLVGAIEAAAGRSAGGVRSELLAASAPFGAQYVVAAWHTGVADAREGARGARAGGGAGERRVAAER